ncbi:FG-GAP-like repeat-containing protein [Streptomyces sp. NPDC052396]|uniref:FG-GAP-like repeat-containing protein n=1 Tax=Streptomyces sp. NPDC052396 TaxID=3365689 RepID=UPI0037D57CE9
MKNRWKSICGLGLGVLSVSLLSGPSAEAASVRTWEKVAQCESSGDWSINTGNGYYGGLQISKSTWDAFGGQQYAAYPNQATERQQILVAEKILAGQGPGAWGCSDAADLADDHANPYPSTVRFADFDGDGKADYVTIGSNGAIKVWLNKGGDGRGGWQALGQVATGSSTDPSRVRFADFDGDGKADYEVINSDGSMSVWLNKGGDGRGGWQALGKVATGSSTDPSRVRFADFDGDGKADYEVINSDGSMSVWLNKGGDGHGGWQALGKVATGSATDQSRVKLADFNGDHKADYATIGSNGAINVWVNKGGDGHGGWQALGQVGTGATADQDDVQFADFNGDGKADYIVTDPTTNASRVYLWNGGDGNGGWTNLGQVASGVTNN